MTPFQIFALNLLCGSSSGRDIDRSTCTVYVVDGKAITSYESLGRFPVDSCYGPEFDQPTNALVLGGNIYQLNDGTLSLLPIKTDKSWTRVYRSGTIGYGIHNGRMFFLDGNTATEFPDIASTNVVFGLSPYNQTQCLVNWKYNVSRYNGLRKPGFYLSASAPITSMHGSDTGMGFISRGIPYACSGDRTTTRCGNLQDWMSAYFHGNYVSGLSRTGKLYYIDYQNGTVVYTVDSERTFKAHTAIKGSDQPFYAIDADERLFWYENAYASGTPLAQNSWTEIHDAGEGVAYGISAGRLYRIAPNEAGGAPQRIGDGTSWQRAWILNGSKVVAISLT